MQHEVLCMNYIYINILLTNTALLYKWWKELYALSPIYNMQFMLLVDYCMCGNDTTWNEYHEEFWFRLDFLEVFAKISVAYFRFSSEAANS